MSHDLQAYQRLELSRLKNGSKIRAKAFSKAGLLYELCFSDVLEYERTLLMCMSVLVKNNFWLEAEDNAVKVLLD